jgi:hypothetical protein
MIKFTEKSPTGKNCIPLKNAAQGIDLPKWSIHETTFLESRLEGDAADQLAAYESTGLEPDEIPQWIPVSERLPEKWHNENCEPIEFNVMLPGAKEATTLCFNGSQWFEYDWKNMKRKAGYYTVTHWQPLPQPPKGEKQ